MTKVVINEVELEVFPGANLSWANLSRANLSRADLSRANLSRATLEGATLPAFQIPQEGTLTVYKKLKNNLIAKLLVPEEAKRTASLVGRKCRAEYVRVLEIKDKDGVSVPKGSSLYDGYTYTVGDIIKPNSYDPDIRIECTNGIHFFLTKEEAEAY